MSIRALLKLIDRSLFLRLRDQSTPTKRPDGLCLGANSVMTATFKEVRRDTMSKIKGFYQCAAALIVLAFTLGSSFGDPQSPKVRTVDVKVEKGLVKLIIKADKPV